MADTANGDPSYGVDTGPAGRFLYWLLGLRRRIASTLSGDVANAHRFNIGMATVYEGTLHLLPDTTTAETDGTETGLRGILDVHFLRP